MSISMPKYVGTSIPMKTVITVRMTDSQLNNLQKLKTATEAPSSAVAIRLCMRAEETAIKDGLCSPEDFTPNTDYRPCIWTFKVTEGEKELLATLTYYYGAKTYTQLLCYLIDKYSAIADAEAQKAVI